jgi:hypothetical protein
MHRRSSWRALLVAALTAVIFVSGTGVASAAPAGPIDDSSYSEAQKAVAETKAAAETAKRTCALILPGPLAGRWQDDCEKVMSSKFTRETVPVLAATALCAALPNLVLKSACTLGVALESDKIKSWFWDAYKVALGAAEAVVAAVAFVANPAHAIDFFLNSTKGDSISLFTAAMGEALHSVSFDAGAPWWRAAYGATAGIGLVVLAAMMLLTLSQASSGKLGPQEARRSMGHAGIGMVMLSMGPPVAWAIANLANGMDDGIITWMGPDVVTFLGKVPLFAQMTSAMTGGIGMGLIIFGGLFLGSLGILGTFLVQKISLYILGAVMGIAWGMKANPRWRRKAMRMPMMWVGLVMAKPAMLLVLGIVVKMSNALILNPEGGDTLQAIVDALTIILAIVAIAVAPWMLLKHFPLLPDGGDSSASSGPVATNAAVGMAGSTAQSLAMNRARTASNESNSSRASSNPSPAPTQKHAAPAAKSGPAQGAQKGAQQGAAPALRSATAGGAKAGGGAAKTAGGAAGGAATGGALLMAQLAAQAGQAAMTKAREAAAAAAPETQGEA